MKKRLLSFAMALCMALSLLPAPVFAEENAETPVCTCEEACTAEDMDAGCAVCGAEGAAIENCCKYAEAIKEESAEAATQSDAAESEEAGPEATESEAAGCNCESSCTAEAMNTECPVCGAVGAVVEDCCKYVAPEQDESTETTTPPEAPVCVCEEACTVEAMDENCPVCGMDGAVPENCAAYVAPAAEEQIAEVVQLGAPASEEPEPESDQTAVEKVQAMINALPTVEELENADDEKVDEVYAAVQVVCDALDELSTEELDQITGLDKLDALMEWFTGPVATYEEGDYSYLDYKIETDGTITITGLNDPSMTEVTIPASIGGVPVTAIGDIAFDTSNLTSITIPDGVESIGSGAFFMCYELTSITIPDSVKSIGFDAFSQCEKLTSITIPHGVESIGSSTFYSCKSLTSITIPNSVTVISDSAFKNCRSLTSITIPDGVKSIGPKVFFDCTSLESIFLPEGLDVSYASIPGMTSQVRYRFDTSKGEVTITGIELGTGKTGAVIPAKICGYDVVAISDEGLLTKISSHTCAGGQATCQTKAICGICKQEYGDYAGHTLAKTDAKAPTCTEDGNTAYWICSVCHKLFSDEDGKTETTQEVVAINANGHTLAKVGAKNPTCTKDGNTAYWICSVCHKLFSDEKGTIETTLEAVTIKAAHKLTKTEARNATVTETGNIEYWQCQDCGDIFSDPDGKNEITLEDTVIAKLPPKIIEGTGQSVTAGEKKALSFRSNAAFSDFICVELDGKTLDEKNYTAKEGSTVVTLDADYVSTLSSGEHTIGIVSESGTASTTFTVNAKAGSTDSSQTGTNSTNTPQTGDNSPLALWIALLFVSGGLLTVIGIYGKKKKYNR